MTNIRIFISQVLLLAGLYFVAGQISFSLFVTHSIVTLVIFASEGFALAAVILFGKRLCLGVFLGQLLLALFNGVAWQVAVGLSAINSLEAVIGAILFQRWALNTSLTKISDVSGLLLLIFFILQPFSATLGVSLLWFNHVVPTEYFSLSWIFWWVGNGLGQALVTPLLLVFLSDTHRIKQKLRPAYWLILLAIPLALITFLPISFSLTLAFTVSIPLLIFIAIRGGMALVTLAMFVLTPIILFFTQQQVTDRLAQGDMSSLIQLNAYLLGMSIIGQFIAALLAEHNQTLAIQQRTTEQLQKISDHFPGMICQYRLNPDGSSCFPYASVGIENIYRVSPESVRSTAESVFAILHPDDYQRVVNTIHLSAQRLTVWQQEYRVRFADGSLSWLSGHFMPQREADGATLWYGLIEDITLIKQKEIEYRTIIETSGNGFFCNNFSGHFLSVNSALCNLLGYSEVEMLTMSVMDIDASESIEDAQKHIQSIVRSKHDVFDTKHRRKDGSVIDVRVNMLYAETLGQRFFAFVEDITASKQVERNLKESQVLLQTAQRAARMGHYVMELRPANDMTWTSDTILDEIFGIDDSFIRNMENWQHIIHPDDKQRTVDYFYDTIRQHQEFSSIEYRIIRPSDGDKRWITVWGYIFYDEQECPIRQVGIIQDISKRKLAETELRIAATVFEAQEGMMISDATGVILKVNHAFTAITGYSAEEAIGRTPRFLQSGRHDKAFYHVLWQRIIEEGVWRGEIWNRRKNGEVYPQWLTITAVKNDNALVTHYVATLTDISERKAVEDYINHLAFHDSLTQLPNRRLLQERLKHSIEVSHRERKILGVLMMDLDKFKAVNDNFGHAAGDELLQHVAARIRSNLREMDMVARLGGDEFVVLLEGLGHHDHAANIANTIIDALSQPFTVLRHHRVHIGASVGIALYPEHGNSAEKLLDNADAALYHAKDQGRGCYAYFSERFE
jgi:diguanylate cyclase (GGDEF)-like protein/PAS domain S-box-containing protein